MASRAAGPIDATFVVTHIAGAELAWSSDPDAILELAERHDALVDALAKENDARLVRRTVAEGFLLVFEEPARALRFADALCIALAAGDAALIERFHVGVGIATGPAVRRVTGTETHYSGAPIVRAAELAALPHRAPIRVDARVPDGALGGLVTPHHRSGLEPETVAPLRFVGRQRELDALASAFERGARFVTLLGPGGIGKTRTARQYVAARSAEGRERSVEVFLRDAMTAPEVGRRVAAALGVSIPDERGATDPAKVGDALAREGAIVLLLDNLEQTSADARAAIAAWLERAPLTCVLATSRVRLKIAEEQVVEVEPLSDAEATELFVERATQAGARPETLSDREALLGIVRGSQGAPLALELAAARTDVLSLRELETRLVHTPGALVRASAGGDPRHQSLATAVEWSWNLLHDATKRTLCAAAVFQGGFTLDAIEAVDALEPGRTSVQIGELLDGSLLARDQGAPFRFVMLAPVRDFVMRRPEHTSRAGDLALRHAIHYASVAQEWAGRAKRGDAGALESLAREHDNLVAASERMSERPDLVASIALSTSIVLLLRGPVDACIVMLDRGIALLGHEPATATTRAGLFVARARCLLGVGRLVDAERDSRQAVGLAVGADARAEAHCLHALTLVAVAELDAALEAVDAAEACAGSELPFLEGVLIGIRAIVWHARGELERAEELYEASHRAFHSRGAHLDSSLVLARYATLCVERGKHAEAVAIAGDELTRCREMRATRYEAWLLLALSLDARAMGALVDARTLALEAATKARDAAIVRYVDVAESHVALLDVCEGNLDPAERTFISVAERASARDDLLMCVFGLVGLALARGVRGDREGVAQALERARSEARRRNRHDMAQTLDAAAWLVEGCTSGALSADDLEQLSRAGIGRNASTDGRVGYFVLLRAAAVVRARQGAAQPIFRVARDGSRFRLPGGATVDLSRKPTLRALLASLVDAHVERPGRSIPREQLIRAVWPDVHSTSRFATNRLHVSVSSLRKAGATGLIVSDEGDYRLDPAAVIVEA